MSRTICIATDDMGKEYTTRRGLTPSSYALLLDHIDVPVLLNRLGILKKGTYRKLTSKDAYMLLCPFHGERTPSCEINLQEKKFSCRGCGMCGNMIDFVKEIQETSFLQAIYFLRTLFQVDGLQYETKKIDLSEILDTFQERVHTLLYKVRIDTQTNIAAIVSYLDFFEEQEPLKEKKNTIRGIRDFFIEKGLTDEGLRKEDEKFLKNEIPPIDYHGVSIKGIDIIQLYIDAREGKKVLDMSNLIRFEYIRDYMIYNVSGGIEKNSIGIAEQLFTPGPFRANSLEKLVDYSTSRQHGEEYETFRHSTYGKNLEEVLMEDNK